MSAAWIAVLTPPLLMVPAMGALTRLANSVRSVEGEVARKAMHMAFGCAGLLFPVFLVDRWMILTSAALVTAWMLAVRHVPALRRQFGGALHGICRKTGGEFYFAAALVFLLLNSVNAPLFYVVPLLVLTFADSIAALAGRRFPFGQLGGPARGKTALGSAAFVAIAFVCAALPIAMLCALEPAQVLQISLAIALVGGVTEAISRGGSDNFTVPLAVWLTMHWAGLDEAVGTKLFSQVTGWISG
jgi:dolichol kinase